ncbi:MAG: hypothetical protein V6011_01580 [Candidatus Dasytiphilus stammeri]
MVLSKLKRNCTLLVIVHSISIIEKADEIFVLEEGKIIERGNPHQLLHNNGPYAQMYKTPIDHT